MRSRRRGWVALLLVSVPILACAPCGRASGATWRDDVACGRDLGSPHAVTRAGCAAAHCVAGPADLEVCACRPDAADDRSGVRFDLRTGGAVRTWRAEPLLGDTGSFRVQLADLDGDGRDEILIGTETDVSNGMAVQYWSLCVLDGRRPGDAPSCVALEDFPFFGMATRAPGARACRVLETHWRWGAEAKRGEGLYLVGQWLADRDGKLVPDGARPHVARRYLYRWAAQRREVIENARSAPILWWRDPTTRVVRCPDRLCQAPPP